VPFDGSGWNEEFFGFRSHRLCRWEFKRFYRYREGILNGCNSECCRWLMNWAGGTTLALGVSVLASPTTSWLFGPEDNLELIWNQLLDMLHSRIILTTWGLRC
jgi:hypothetical protein